MCWTVFHSGGQKHFFLKKKLKQNKVSKLVFNKFKNIFDSLKKRSGFQALHKDLWNEASCLVLCVAWRRQCDGTHVWGWEGSSPRETLSPWISLKHFSQKWYLSARSPYFGELHRSSSAQPITERARRSSRQSGQDRPGGGHTGGGRGQGRSSPAANRDAGFLCGRVFWFCA